MENCIVNVVKIENKNTEVVKTLKVAKKEFGDSIWSWLRRFEVNQASEVFGAPVKSLGISQYVEGLGLASTYREFKGAEGNIFKQNSAMLKGGKFESERITQTAPVRLADGTDAPFCAGFDFYETGYVIATGTTGYSIMGDAHDRYIASIGRSSLKTGSRHAAKVYSNLKAVKAALEKNVDFLNYFAKKCGYKYQCKPASQYFADMVKKEEESSDRKRISNNALRQDIDSLLQEINKVPEEEERYILPKLTPKEEAVARMEELKIMGEAIRKFKNGHILVSEVGGALFDPDKDARKAIDETEKYGLPYHVILNRSSIGNMYSVLYVSNNPDEWVSEHYSRREHVIPANVYNAGTGFSEVGMIGIVPANGGLVRNA